MSFDETLQTVCQTIAIFVICLVFVLGAFELSVLLAKALGAF
jgi:hypothetical protein